VVETNKEIKNEKKDSLPKETKEEEVKFDIDESDFKNSMDSINELFKENALILITDTDGAGAALNKAIMRTKFPNISSSDVGDVIGFTGSYIHSITTHNIDHFYRNFKEEDKDKVQRIVELLKTHENFGPLVFRMLRYGNYPSGEILIHKKTIEIPNVLTPGNTVYYDITIPYQDNEQKPRIMRLEVDKYEIESIIASLAKILEEEKKGD
jgi:hypothetical protein